MQLFNDWVECVYVPCIARTFRQGLFRLLASRTAFMFMNLMCCWAETAWCYSSGSVVVNRDGVSLVGSDWVHCLGVI